ncbi:MULTISPECIES: bifunctional protein-disulfide isomerase/oxidoreductase DsbC [unclassified Shewanella]|uniref:bifunctional protein-disulfide isomerase/oxidoreductase DsbC n=1 Tax=unclassified Shewanella TaxID=196818 RepID=UPI001BC748D6|nr:MULTISPECIES: bifunctional protein-disulfide isomerase/oxidoreductase DsbC [unclassified Shewanella]GIU07280.1 thiol:disulfide interchange protein DsbC [Shewanella sp. MBTL60-112-B1]GIU35670.1 thiol:disulfide interchange protein DsbC [Shewanella sp. MBTL60-112-B2]
MKFTRTFSLIAAMMIAPAALAASNSSDDTAALKQKLSDTLSVEVISIKPSPVAELYEAFTDRGVLYISKDGSKLFHGSLYDLDKGMKNLTEAAMAGPRLDMLKPLEENMLVYKAKNEKHVVTIFTDVSCGYCRKLHNEMDGYNDLGITVRYLAFPRAGVPSANADEMESVWCATDPLKAMGEAKNGKAVKQAKCDAKIAEQYHAGQAIGINGTPAIILEDGTLIPGYQPPKALLRTLESVQ